jgi:hypothetical protein
MGRHPRGRSRTIFDTDKHAQRDPNALDLANDGLLATGSSEVLNFMSIGTPAGGPPVALLSDVSLSAIPEPATWALMVLGFGGLGFAAYRRTKRSAAAFAEG